MRVISCSSFTDSSSRCSSAMMRKRVGSERARRDLSVENMSLSVLHKHFSWQLFHQPLHFQPQQRHRNSRTWQTALSDYVIYAHLLMVEGAKDLLLIVRQLEGRKHTRFVWGGRAVARRK